MITGHLTEASPLRSIWPNGDLPLTRVHTINATLGDSKLPQPVYLLDLYACTTREREGMAQRLVEFGQCELAEAREHVQSVREFPIRAQHIAAVSEFIRGAKRS